MDELKWNRIKMFSTEIIPCGLNPVFVYCICSKNDSFLSVFSKSAFFFLYRFFFRFSIMCRRGQFFFLGGGGGEFVNMPTRRYQFITLAQGRQCRSAKEKIFLPKAQITSA